MIDKIYFATTSADLARRGIRPASNKILIVRNKCSNETSTSIHSVTEIIDSDPVLYRRLLTKFLFHLKDPLTKHVDPLRLLQLDSKMSGWWLSKPQLRSVHDNNHYFLPILELLVLEQLHLLNPQASIRILNCPLLWYKVQHILPSTQRSSILASILKPLYLTFQYLTIASVISLNYLHGLLYYLKLLYSTCRCLYPPDQQIKTSTKDILFVAPLTHLDVDQASQGVFTSHYWSGLTDELERASFSCDFLHLFHPYHHIPDIKAATRIISTLNKNRRAHYLLCQYVTPLKIASASIEFLKYTACSIYLLLVAARSTIFEPTNTLSLFISQQFLTINGPAIFQYLIFKRLFRSHFAIHKYRKIVYISEYQFWEHSLLSHSNNMQTYAVFHTYLRTWDLRYYPYPFLLRSPNKYKFSIPTGFIVNSHCAQADLLKSGYSGSQMYILDALRYQEFNRSFPSNDDNPSASTSLVKPYILIATDHITSVTIDMLNIIHASRSLLPASSLVLRQHPAYYDPDLCRKYSVIDSNSLQIPVFQQINQCSLFLVAPDTSLALYSFFLKRLTTAYYKQPNRLDSSILSTASVPSFTDVNTFCTLINSGISKQKKSSDPLQFSFSPNYRLWLNFVSQTTL